MMCLLVYFNKIAFNSIMSNVTLFRLVVCMLYLKSTHCGCESHFLLLQKKFTKQECIPVGCVPPAAVAVRGLHQADPLRSRPPRPGTPHWSRPPRQQSPCCKACWDSTTPTARHAGIPPAMPAGIPPPPVNRMTVVKILPCPKLRLRAVIIQNNPKCKNLNSKSTRDFT